MARNITVNESMTIDEQIKDLEDRRRGFRFVLGIDRSIPEAQRKEMTEIEEAYTLKIQELKAQKQ